MGYNNEGWIQVKKEFWRMITRIKLDSARKRFIYGLFETYLQLTDEEEERLLKEVENLPEVEKIKELPISYEEEGNWQERMMD